MNDFGLVLGLESAILALLGMLSGAIALFYKDLKRDRERVLQEHRADRERWRAERAAFHDEIKASTAERAECRARLEALEQVVERKLEAAQPRDAHGRFEAERG